MPGIPTTDCADGRAAELEFKVGDEIPGEVVATDCVDIDAEEEDEEEDEESAEDAVDDDEEVDDAFESPVSVFCAENARHMALISLASRNGDTEAFPPAAVGGAPRLSVPGIAKWLTRLFRAVGRIDPRSETALWMASTHFTASSPSLSRHRRRRPPSAAGAATVEFDDGSH